MLFKNYSTIEYVIGNKTVTLLDIFRNISFTNIETSKAFDDYYIQDGETPETVSAKLYANTAFSWVVMLVNNLANIKQDWFQSQFAEMRYQESTIGGDAIYIPALPDLVPGDILVKVTATGPNGASAIDNQIYRHIADFDPYFRKIRGICGAGQFTTGDLILFARQNSNNGTVNPLEFEDQSGTGTKINYTSILLSEPYRKSVIYFYNSSNVVIDPYRTGASGSDSIKSSTTYLNPNDVLTENNFTYSLLYKYGLSGGTAPDNLLKKEVGSDVNDKYLKKQKIKVLKPEYLTTVVNAIENALQSNELGKIIKIEL
jgi:Base plate wedge protein 53